VLAEDTWADLEALWTSVFDLYRGRPASGTIGAEVVDLALAAEDLLRRDETGAASAIRRAQDLLEDLGEPAAS
jgi:hypothetical protein